MVVLFPGAPMSVVGDRYGGGQARDSRMARPPRWCGTAWVWRLVLAGLFAGLAVINAAGVYAQLVAAHVGERGLERIPIMFEHSRRGERNSYTLWG